MIVKINGQILPTIVMSPIVVSEKTERNLLHMLSMAPVAATVPIAERFEPLMTLLMDLAGPVCRIMFILGFVMVIVGKPRQGIDKMKWAAIGYIGIQWTPMLMDIIKGAGAGI
ncbi:hypothetical protein D3C78_18740 [compost metagenome]